MLFFIITFQIFLEIEFYLFFPLFDERQMIHTEIFEKQEHSVFHHSMKRK